CQTHDKVFCLKPTRDDLIEIEQQLTVILLLNLIDRTEIIIVVEYIQQQNHSQLLLDLDEIISRGFEAKDFIVGLTEHFRNLLVCQQPETLKLLETSENVRQKYHEQSQRLSPTFILNAFNLCSDSERQTKISSNPRLTVELALVKLAYLESAIQVAQNGNGHEKKKH
ncbi:MAG: hypothetical protein AAFV78_20325, partial [Bacteroidota bacterium]